MAMSKGIVAGALSNSHSTPAMVLSVRRLLDSLSPPLTSLVKPTDRVLIKVNMACSGLRAPSDRVTTHPTFVAEMIRALRDCRAKVSLGDDVARVGKHCEEIWRKTGMWDVAQQTGSELVDFVTVGAREVRGSLLYPRKYLVTNAYFDTDVVINAANCRSHPNIVLSGAIKNMFGFVIGKRKALMHHLFWDNPSSFGRAIADVCRTIPPVLSFLDLTTVREGQGAENTREAIQHVGLIIGGVDPVALDTIAAHAIGYENLPIWTTYHGNKMGLGESDIGAIQVRGLDWPKFNKRQLAYPLIETPLQKSPYDWASNLANRTILRQRPVISREKCTGCGDCEARCPVACIRPTRDGVFKIDLGRCVDCGCCLTVCEEEAVSLTHVGVARTMHFFVNHLNVKSSSRMALPNSNTTKEFSK
jgi:uncharacterized protein (DUF362 family)/ferredoxin